MRRGSHQQSSLRIGQENVGTLNDPNPKGDESRKKAQGVIVCGLVLVFYGKYLSKPGGLSNLVSIYHPNLHLLFRNKYKQPISSNEIDSLKNQEGNIIAFLPLAWHLRAPARSSSSLRDPLSGANAGGWGNSLIQLVDSLQNHGNVG